ncbi:MFS transporter [Propioniciclava sp.]|uniref:MFS transporter n=1 Tax=Propioniciclava sp. TaxID=2038686 RepID=UPI00262375E4|nr:MFS transporter [Propioniciclava sp.]
MTSATPSTPATTAGRGRTWAFAAASASLVAVFAASASPIPVFNVYRAENGITTADISLSVVAYFLGTIGALLCLGRLANHLGRRPTALATLLLLVAGSVVMIGVTGLAPLLAGRFLMGVGAGLASSALTTYIVDTAPARPDWLASVVTSQASMVGLTLGSLAAGALVQYVVGARTVVYVVMVVLLAVCVALILMAPETGRRQPGAWASLRPRVFVPAHARPLLPVATMVFASTWALGAFYQSFVPTIAREQLRTDNALIVALLFAAYMAPSVVGAPVGGRFAPAAAQRLGMLVYLSGVVGILAGLVLGNVWLLVPATMVASAGQGIAVSASMRALLHGTDAADRAPVMSAIFLICYSGAMVPNIIAGQLSHVVGTVQIAFGYGVLAAAGTIVALLFARDPEDL